MMDDAIGRIQSRISEIQSRLSSLNTPAPAPPETLGTPAGEANPTFSQTLQRAQSGAASVSSAPSVSTAPIAEITARARAPLGEVTAPPASLGPLPPMPTTGAGVHLVPLTVAPVHAASAGGYDDLIEKYASQNGLTPALVRAVIKTESDGNPRCVSRAGAMGLMQLMPANVREAGISDPFDPEQNIAAGTQQLSGLMKQYGGDLDLTLAGYNAGPGNVKKYGGVPPFAETQNYIRKVRAAMGKG
ncbi:MAG: lytic transglycosylase domain-containing protein [Armatimonadota bacterium]|nr:lytic transglycosylase domain-containing protein [Armatimonadota bacterium]